MKSFGQLKLSLIQKGVFIPPDVIKAPEIACGVCSEQEGEEISLALAENFIVKVLLQPVGKGCGKLSLQDGTTSLVSGTDRIDVDIIPMPNFLKDHQKKRTPLSENSCLDGYCLNIFLRALRQKNLLNLSREIILSLIRSAFEEGAADLVQLNMDYCNEPDRGFNRLAPLVEEIKKKFSTFVALRGFPPKDIPTLDKIYAAGIDLLNFPLEGFVGPGQSKGIVKPGQVQEALEYATGIFSPGTVWTEIHSDTDSPQRVHEKIDELTGKGILPMLKLQKTSISANEDYGQLEKTVHHLGQAAQRHKIPLKWLYPNCRFVTPLDTRFFTEEPESARLNAKPVYKSRLGRKASEGFAALRRKLRIRNISDSYESAGL